MKFSSVALTTLAALASFSVGAEEKAETTVTLINTSTHKYGKFDKTSRTHGTTSGTHRFGRFNKTSRTHATTTGTHKYGRFNKTSRTHGTTTGTHKYGKFNKTSRTHATTTGTHKYGKFDNTRKHRATEIVYKAQANAAAPAANLGSLQVFGLTAGSAIVAGGLMLL